MQRLRQRILSGTIWVLIKKSLHFIRSAGTLRVLRNDEGNYTLDFPTDTLSPRDDQSEIIHKILGIKPLEIFRGKDDYMAVLPKQSDIEALKPDFTLLKSLDSRGLIATAKGDSVDFVSRCFFP